MEMAVEHKIRSGKYCTGTSGSADSFLDLRSEIYYAEMYESADLDGASGFQKFWKITLPLVSPSMFFLLTMGLMKAMRAFDMIYMFIGKDAWSTGGPLLEAVRTMVYGIYFNGFTRMDKLQDKWVNYD